MKSNLMKRTTAGALLLLVFIFTACDRATIRVADMPSRAEIRQGKVSIKRDRFTYWYTLFGFFPDKKVSTKKLCPGENQYLIEARQQTGFFDGVLIFLGVGGLLWYPQSIIVTCGEKLTTASGFSDTVILKNGTKFSNVKATPTGDSIVIVTAEGKTSVYPKKEVKSILKN